MITSNTEDLLIDLEDKVLVLTLNRPDKLNALSGEMISAVNDALRASVTDPDVGAVMVTGSGRGFCAGGDVSAMGGGGASTFEDGLDRQRIGQEMSRLLYTIPKVTIAAVNGAAAGAGLGIAMSCDLRFASAKAKFTTAFAKVGFGGDYGTSWQLTRLVGQSKAKELFFLSELLDAQEAHRVNLVNRVLPAEDFRAEALELAKQIANGPLVSFRYMKENVNLAMTNDFHTILDREGMTHLRCAQTEDHKEGVAAFMEKRAPSFVGR
jgi:2-(1,2-epoxy-1,2-dihydrophenyl)acetyl-CoA isomerase